MNEIPNVQLIYSKILSAGSGAPLSAKSNVYKFVDITLSDVVQILAGDHSIIALTTQGLVYGRGNNTYGELALGDTKERKEWTKTNGFPSAVKQVAYGSNHALFLTVDGQVFSCGSNSFGQLVSYFLLLLTIVQGIGNTENQSTLNPVLKGKNAKKIVTALLEGSSYVLCNNNELYAFGNNNFGSLVRCKLLLNCI